MSEKTKVRFDPFADEDFDLLEEDEEVEGRATVYVQMPNGEYLALDARKVPTLPSRVVPYTFRELEYVLTNLETDSRSETAKWLDATLTDAGGSLERPKVEASAEAAGISMRLVQTAAQEIGVRYERRFRQASVWHLR